MVKEYQHGCPRLYWAFFASAGLHFAVLAFAFLPARSLDGRQDSFRRELIVRLQSSSSQPLQTQSNAPEIRETNTERIPEKPVVQTLPKLPTVTARTAPETVIGKSETVPTPTISSTSKSQVQEELPAAPEYLNVVGLDPTPKPLHDINPEYPAAAGLREGSVVLRLLISELGNVDNVAVVRSYPRGLFDQSALEAFGRAKFSPAKLLGMPVKSQLTVEVVFTPINRGANVTGRGY